MTPKPLVLCSFGLLTESGTCGFKARYRAEARSGPENLAVLYLCSDHIHRAWELGQLALQRKFPSQTSKVKSIHLHQIMRAATAEAAK
jgi:hypothetical protein